MTTRVGCVYRPQFAPEQLAVTARAADEAGVDDLWLWEDCFLSGGVSMATIALSHSERLAVGVGVLPVPMRNVAVMAMEIATLNRVFPGRVRIGVGHGVQDWMRQIGEKVASPMTLLREYFTCLAALLRGESVTYTGKYVSLDGVKLDWPPGRDIELFAAAMGPRTLELSGELATGTVITGGTTPDVQRDAIDHIQRGMAKRTAPAPHSIVTYLMCAYGPDASTQIHDEIGRWGFSETDDVAAYGDAQAIAAAARRWIDAGTDTIVFQPAPDVDIEGFVRFVGDDVQPLLKD